MELDKLNPVMGVIQGKNYTVALSYYFRSECTLVSLASTNPLGISALEFFRL